MSFIHIHRTAQLMVNYFIALSQIQRTNELISIRPFRNQIKQNKAKNAMQNRCEIL